jgi:hypothetical protein
MPYYITAWRAEGDQVLGNLDGQTCLRHRRPQNSPLWLHLGVIIRSPHVRFWLLETQSGRTLARRPNPNFKEPS